MVGEVACAGPVSGLVFRVRGGLESVVLMLRVVRGILGMLNAASLVALARSVRRNFGASAGAWFVVLQASQFHAMYYASRTLPNMFAFLFSRFEPRSGLYHLLMFASQSGIAESAQRQYHTL